MEIQLNVSKRTDPKLAERLMLEAGLKPLEPYKSANEKWKCLHLDCGQIVFPQYSLIKRGQGGCRPCSYAKTGLASRVSPEEALKKLKQQKLELVGKYKWVDKRTSFQIKCLLCNKKSNVNWDTLGKKGRNKGCEKCSRTSAGLMQVTLEKHLELLAKHNLEAIGKHTGNSDLVKVRCLVCGKRKEVRRYFLLARKNLKLGCMDCAGAKIPNPKKIAQVMKKAKLEPLVPYPGGHAKWKCKCLNCGEIGYPAFNSILRGQGGCIPCGLVAIGNSTRTAQADAIAIMFKGDIKPLEPYVNMNAPWKCRCLVCKRIITPSLANVKSGHKGCVYCAPAGLGMQKKSYVYLITNEELNAHKVGIGNVKKHMDRLGRFNARGWVTYKVWQFETGREALDVEKMVFKVIRKDLKIPVYLSYEQMKSTGGHVETMGADSISLLDLEKIIKKAIRAYRK
jgi:hypothetical protein